MEWEVGQLPTDPLLYRNYLLHCIPFHRFEEPPEWSWSSVAAHSLKPAAASSESCAGLEFEVVQKYFDRPIAEAAKELGMGLTLLKKHCRRLGINRWPHRKIRSLNSLIHNLKELGVENWKEAESMLEEQRRMVEQHPHLQLNDATKKIRQRRFKANYHNNCRKRMKKTTPSPSTIDIHSRPAPTN